MKNIIIFIICFTVICGFSPVPKSIFCVGDSSFGSTNYAVLKLLLENQPAGYIVNPAGEYDSGVSLPSSGNISAAINYVGAVVSNWYDGSPSASDGCYLYSNFTENKSGCLELYKPEIVIMTLGYNDYAKLHSIHNDSPTTAQALYQSYIDYITTSSTLVFVTSYPLDKDEGYLTGDDDGFGAYTTTTDIDYTACGSDSDCEDILNHNYRVFANRIRDANSSNSKFYFVDVNKWFLDNYADPDDWCDTCLNKDGEDLHVHLQSEACAQQVFKVFRMLIQQTVPALKAWHEVE